MFAVTSVRVASGAGAHCRQAASVIPAIPDPPLAVVACGSKPDAAMTCPASRGPVSVVQDNAAPVMARRASVGIGRPVRATLASAPGAPGAPRRWLPAAAPRTAKPNARVPAASRPPRRRDQSGRALPASVP
jgi:hypothetical protein